MDIFKYEKGNQTTFENIKDRHCFYSGGVLYKKIFKQDLAAYGITVINAVSIIHGGLTKFDNDEDVIEAIVEHEHIKHKRMIKKLLRSLYKHI